MVTRLSLAVRFALVMAAVSCGAAAISYFQQSDIAIKAVRQIKLDRANSLRAEIRVEIADEINQLERMARLLQQDTTLAAAASLATSAQGKQKLQQVLEPVFKVLGINSLAVINHDSHVLSRMGDSLPDPKIKALWGVSEALAGRETLSVTTADTGLMVYAVVPLSKEEQNTGALILGLALDSKFLQRIYSEKKTRISMADANGHLLATYSPGDSPILVDTAQAKASLSLKDSVHTLPEQDGFTAVYFADSVLDQTLVWIMTMDDRELVMAHTQQQNRALAAALSLGIAGALVLGYFGHRHARVILDIKSRAEQSIYQVLGHAQAEIQILPARLSEIESLGHSLDVITRRWAGNAKELAQVHVQLQHAKEALEQKLHYQVAVATEGVFRFKKLVEVSMNAILLCSMKGVITYANPATLRMIQCGDRHELEGCGIASIFAVEDQARVMTDVAHLLSFPTHTHMKNLRVVMASGDTATVDINSISFLEAGVIQIHMSLHDVTLQRNHEVALQNQLNFIDQLVQAIPLPLSVRDAHGQYLRINQAYEKKYGITSADVLSRSLFDVFPFAQASLISRNDQRAVSSPQAIIFDHVVALSGHSKVHMHSQICSIFRDDGSVIGVIQVDADLTQIRLQESALREVNRQLSAMSQHLMRAQEEERRRIARDLHDQVGQILSALKLTLRAVAKRPSIRTDDLIVPVEMVEEILGHTRDLSASLHPHILENLGLEAAVGALINRFGGLNGQKSRLFANTAVGRSTTTLELVAYRVIQESITNSMRHANATSLEVNIAMQGDALLVTVQDDGDGFDVKRVFPQGGEFGAPSLGIASMRERVEEVGGQFDIQSSGKMGTVVTIRLPWRNLPTT